MSQVATLQIRTACLLLLLVWIVNTPRKAVARQEETSLEVVFEAERGETTEVNGIVTSMLINANFQQGDTYLRADSARQEGPTDYFFTGNVRIVERGDTVYADVVRYNSETKIGRASGNVSMSDGSVILLSTAATYHAKEKRTEFASGVQYADSSTVLTSETGTYLSDESRATFYGRIRLRQKDLYLEADSINYARQTDVLRAGGNVVVERTDNKADSLATDRNDWFGADGQIFGFGDATDRSVLFSDHIYYDGAVDSSWISGNVFLLRLRVDSTATDSLMVKARAMILTRSEEADQVIAIDSVIVSENNFSVIGDSLVYDRLVDGDVERIESRMFGSPIAWLNESQINSDSLQIWGSEGAIDSLRATGGIFVASMEPSIDHIQQLKGRTLSVYFEEDSIRTMTVRLNAETLYYIEPNPGDSVVAVRTSADQIDFTFEDGVVVDIHEFVGIEGTFYPDNLLDQVQDLVGFAWAPERRPSRALLREELLLRNRMRTERQQAPNVVTDRSRTVERDN